MWYVDLSLSANGLMHNVIKFLRVVSEIKRLVRIYLDVTSQLSVHLPTFMVNKKRTNRPFMREHKQHFFHNI